MRRQQIRRTQDNELRTRVMARALHAVAAALTLALVAVAPAQAQSSLAARLASDRLGAVEPGAYEAGNATQFMIDREQDHYLLRFAGDPEVFVLYGDHASLGGRVLKYDSGKMVLMVSGWGGMTLYTDKKPSGLPTTRTGDSVPPQLPDVSLDEVKAAAADEGAHMAYVERLTLSFDADWNKLAGDARLRALCFDALGNAARGLARFAATPAGRRALANNIGMVMMQTSGKPTLQRKGRSLIVTYDPDRGYAGRASSRAIAKALHTIFKLPQERG